MYLELTFFTFFLYFEIVELPRLGDDEGLRVWLLLHSRGTEVGVGGVVVLLEGDDLSVPLVEILHQVVVIVLIASWLLRSPLDVVHMLQFVESFVQFLLYSYKILGKGSQ